MQWQQCDLGQDGFDLQDDLDLKQPYEFGLSLGENDFDPY